MFVKNLMTLYTSANVIITHDSSTLYNGAVANIPFYFLNEAVISISAVNTTAISLAI